MLGAPEREDEVLATFGQDLIQSVREALAIARGGAGPSRTFMPPPVDIAASRRTMGLSQDQQAFP